MSDMHEAGWWLGAFSGALLLGLKLALPALVLVVAAGLAASFVQTMIGYGDAAVGFGMRVAGAVAGLVLFGGWIAATMVAYWGTVGQHAARLLGGGR